MNYLKSHWRGDIALWRAFIVNGALAYAAMIIAALLYDFFDLEPLLPVNLGPLLMAFGIGCLVWYSVGVTRSGLRVFRLDGLWNKAYSAAVVLFCLACTVSAIWGGASMVLLLASG